MHIKTINSLIRAMIRVICLGVEASEFHYRLMECLIAPYQHILRHRWQKAVKLRTYYIFYLAQDHVVS